MDTMMNFHLKGAVKIQEGIDNGYEPPTYEIAKALEHYRKNIKFPMPYLMNTRFLYYEGETGKETEDGDSLNDTFTEVVLYDREGKKLKTYTFSTYSRMVVK